MRLGFISDLHINQIPMEYELLVELLRSWLRVRELTHLIIGGDISNDWKTTCRFVEDLQEEAEIPIYFIPGNHDYWCQEKPHQEIDTWIQYQNFAKHPQCLMEKTLRITDKLVIIGHSGWYNHAYHGGNFTEEELEAGLYNSRTWQDKHYVNWGMSDREASKLMANRVKEELDTLDKATQVILVTHMVTIPEFIVPMPHEVFDFFNAFIATNDFDDIITNYPISHHFMGHVHYRKELSHQAGIKFIVNCLGNVNEWHTNDLLTELNDSLYVVEI